MALKSDRNEVQTDISFFMNEVATRGGIASMSTAGSGAAMDQGAALVTYAASASGQVPMGLLLNDMVNLDLTRQHINQHKDEVQKGGKVTILRKGYVVTNNLSCQTAAAAGDLAYVQLNGTIANSGCISDDTGRAGSSIGTFVSSIDQDGYAKVEINLP